MIVFSLYHMYEYGENNEFDDTKNLGIYSSKELAEEAIKRYSILPGFKKYPLDCFYVDKITVDADTGWADGFVSSDEITEELKIFTAFFNKWIGRDEEPEASWEDNNYYQAICAAKVGIQNMRTKPELVQHIQDAWSIWLPECKKTVDEFDEIAEILLRDFITKQQEQ